MNLDRNLQWESFENINLDDPFFDGLKAGYQEFSDWFHRKAKDKALIMKDEFGGIQGFMYLKEKNEAINDVTPPMPFDRYLKIGTFKINAHGTKLGERFVKKAFDFAIARGIKKIYVTVFSEHENLIDLLARYGFKKSAEKETPNGVENVMLKEVGVIQGKVIEDYPMISSRNNRFLLGIYPEFHTRLFPDSILHNENASIVDDVSHTNSIEKIYICRMKDVQLLKGGDSLVIYRTGDGKGSAEYRAVATSLCMVDEVNVKNKFVTLDEFISYCSPRSVFTEKELTNYFTTWKQMYVIRMTYNVALRTRIIRKRLVEEAGLSRNDYWGFMRLTQAQFNKIASMGGVDDSLILN
uniref:N-acetyltransferase domain-containing protein n=1 Tax=Candidatus Kentrum sp. SD TaxID=2126332 RepID=A0A450YVB8_9GAMM|nr:MAG: hypothetical protein BECKSD772F_GA0070984_10549 [Candidatus Kentron sp. SD]VFK45462.1 MAG: hypothetical protein BECKSD772E_GA0070983_10549 [Candidatus Kentron sp. SD]